MLSRGRLLLHGECEYKEKNIARTNAGMPRYMAMVQCSSGKTAPTPYSHLHQSIAYLGTAVYLLRILGACSMINSVQNQDPKIPPQCGFKLKSQILRTNYRREEFEPLTPHLQYLHLLAAWRTT